MAQATEQASVVRIGAPVPDDQWSALIEAAGGRLTMVDTPGEAEVIAATRDADIIINAGGVFPAHVIEQLQRCRLIIQSSVGYDRIDVPAATARGIMIANL